MYWNLATGLRGFLKEPLTLEQARNIIKERLANREKNLLTIVKRAIYENERSPYLKLLRLAGCEYNDFERMVLAKGIEPTLEKLRDEGVYLQLEEFKGKKDVVRGLNSFSFSETDFDNPVACQDFEISSSGGRSAGTRTMYDYDDLTLRRSVYIACWLDAFDAIGEPLALWAPIMPGYGPQAALYYNKAGSPLWKWFTPISVQDFRPSIQHTLGTAYIVNMCRLWGSKIPKPESVPVEEAWRIAHWISGTLSRHGACYLHTSPSNAVRVCQAAKRRGLDISGAKFAVASEPLTKVKKQEIESTGAIVNSRFVFAEGGDVGVGCFNPSAADDMHFLKDSLALIQQQRRVPHAGVSVDSFLFTSLVLSAPKVLLNVEIGDYGVFEKRRCGCYFDELGFGDHIYNIRSFDKLTSQGMTFFGTDLIRVIEEVLPAKFGGISIDYQVVEEEDDKGNSLISVVVNPTVGPIDEKELIKVVLSELSKGPDVQRMMAGIWSQAQTLRVKRVRPFTTGGLKLMPLHIQRGK